MMTELWHVKHGEVLYKLQRSGIKYPTKKRTGMDIRNINAGYGHTAVIPLLYEYVVQQRVGLPYPQQCATWLYENHANVVERERHEKEVKWRTVKLVLDFYRELHTYGLLVAHDFFGSVRYAKAHDIDLGVDYTAYVSELNRVIGLDKVGVQAAIGSNKAYAINGYFQKLKAGRKASRNCGAAWDGPIHWLTNENRSAEYERESGVLLFSSGHVQDLVDEIAGQGIVLTAVQAELDEIE